MVMEEKVYVGGGVTESYDDDYIVYIYDKLENIWSLLPRCSVRWFCMETFKSKLITVGGRGQDESPTAKVFMLSADSQRWEEYITPMPTARHSSSIVAMATSLIVAGGTVFVGSELLATSTTTVEIYSDSTSQWYTADPLPAPHCSMSSVVRDDLCYFMGGTDCYRASLSSLIERATSPPVSAQPLWKTLPPMPLKYCSAVCLNGCLMTVGGKNSDDQISPDVYVFLDDKWVRLVNSNMPTERMSCCTASLSSEEVIVIGGWFLNLQHGVCIGTLLTE